MMNQKEIKEIKKGEQLGFNRNGWPTIHNMMIPRYLWHLLPQAFQDIIAAKPPVIMHGEPGTPSPPSRVDDEQLEWETIQGYGDY